MIQILHDNFWHIRGKLRIGGILDIGTHCSLIRLHNGEFVFLDSYTLPDPVLEEVYRITGGPQNVTAILNLHPYHTIHCEWMHRAFPDALLYGTRRHTDQWPDLPWQRVHCEAEDFPGLFADDLRFSIPEGTCLVCEDDKVHFSSVLAFHPASGTIHVDDTLSCLKLPAPLSALPFAGRIAFHPSLKKALEPEARAADRFRKWAINLGIDWADARRLSMAHNSSVNLGVDGFPDVVGIALGRAKSVLDSHRDQYG